MIKDISYNEEKNASIVTLLEGFKHKFEDGDEVEIKEVLGMQSKEDKNKSINGIVTKVKVINPSSFTISEDVRNYSPYDGNGIAKQVKVPRKVTFKSIEECKEHETSNEPLYDPNLLMSDFEKMDHKKCSHYIYNAYKKVIESDGFYDADEGYKTCEEIYKYAKEAAPKDFTDAQLKKLYNLSFMFGKTQKYAFPPIAAFLGGMVA